MVHIECFTAWVLVQVVPLFEGKVRAALVKCRVGLERVRFSSRKEGHRIDILVWARPDNAIIRTQLDTTDSLC